jgi:hypothetical protein
MVMGEQRKNGEGKGNIFSVHAVKSNTGIRGTALLIINLGF